MKKSAFPIVIELEILCEDDWVVVQSYHCTSMLSLTSKMEQLKSLYVLNNKDYRIMLTLQSKVNNYEEKIKRVL
jgi:hypothetical protein